MTAKALEDASRAFKKALIERALGAEMSHHLGYAAGTDKPVVHLIRNSLDYASWKDRRALAGGDRSTAPSARKPLRPRPSRPGAWGQKFPTVAAAWRRAWSNVVPFFAFPPAVRRVIYTTNSIDVRAKKKAWKKNVGEIEEPYSGIRVSQQVTSVVRSAGSNSVPHPAV